MTLVLKSDNTLDANVPSLGDKHGIVGPTDWGLMLDFQNQLYVKKSGNTAQALELSTLLTCIRDTEGNILKNGEYVLVGKNEPRLSQTFRKDNFGLLTESRSTNYFKNSNAPASQSIVFTPTGTQYFMARVVGSGSVSIVCNDIAEIVGSGTYQSPLMFKVVKASGTSTMQVNTTGSLSYVSVENCPSGYFSEKSYIQTNNSVFGRGTDVINISPSNLSNSANYTILFQCILNDRLNDPFFSASQQPLLEIGTAVKHYALTAMQAKEQPKELRFRSFDATEKAVGIVGGVRRSSVVAVCVTAQGLRIAIDGKVSDINTLVQNVSLSALRIGGASWTGLENRADGCFTKLAIYDRALTVNELVKVTQSF